MIRRRPKRIALASLAGLLTLLPGVVYAASSNTGASVVSGTPADDPMLAPPPPAQRELKTWDDALELLRSQSPAYIASYENVVRAGAPSRIALAVGRHAEPSARQRLER
jgi:hypothetical protein